MKKQQKTWIKTHRAKDEFDKYKNSLDRYFKKYIRKIYMKNGVGKCYTCGKISTHLDVGHYPDISRDFYSNRWDIETTKMQCEECNRFKHGMGGEFRRKLVLEHGEEKIKFKELTKNKRKPEIWEMKLMIQNFKTMLKGNNRSRKI